MKIATARTRTSKNWRTQDVSWDQILERLRTPMRTAETLREYKAMSREEQGRAKEAAGGFVGGALSCGQRKTENVISRSLLTLDADDAYAGQWDDVTVLWEFRMACYPTHSSTRDKPRLRWVIPTDRDMTPDEYPAVARMVAAWLGIETMDPSTYEIARLMYWPTIPKDAPYDYHEQDGPLLSVDYVLGQYGEGDAWKDVSLWPAAEGEQTIRARSQVKAGDPTEKPGLVGLFCRTFDIYAVLDQFLSDEYTATQDPDRWTYAGGSTAGGAVVYNNGAFLYSNHATDPGSGMSLNAFDLVRIHKFGDRDSGDEAEKGMSPSQWPSYKAMCQWAAGLPEIKRQMAEEKLAGVERDFADLTGPSAGTETAAETGQTAQAISAPSLETHSTPDPAHNTGGENKEWTEKLDLNRKTGECDPTIKNALLIMQNDPNLKGNLRYNLFSERRMRGGGLPWRGNQDPGGPWEDFDDSGLRLYLEDRWKFKSENGLQNAMELAFHFGDYHPVREYLKNLVWDGKERVETLFCRHFGTEDTPLVRAMTRKWMCAAVARVMRPGCKFDNMLVLTGDQNLGKSSFVRILSRGWYNDSKIDMTSKEGYDALQGSWVVELAELASIRRQDVETVKTFLSKSEDTFRPAYARYKKTFLRQCVFLGTTNEKEFLRDRTGNRRFWPIPVRKRADLTTLESEVDQLWAEARVLWAKGESLWLDTADLQDALVDAQAEMQVQDELEGMLTEYLDTPLPDNWEELSPEHRRDFIQGNLPGVEPGKCTLRRDHVCLTEIRVEMLGEDRTRGGGYDLTSRRIANLMNTRRDWVKQERRAWVKGYGQQWVYCRKSPVDSVDNC